MTSGDTATLTAATATSGGSRTAASTATTPAVGKRRADREHAHHQREQVLGPPKPGSSAIAESSWALATLR